ncbi:MAG: aminotransferase class I/II-fold pyridoxal phosphate-dependent enzyme [Pirellulaceae bacterium]|nr:aminotransferase class I/II-fold pyridoxal phosphate-dependent enzyme [Pirellulaceae bacterium]
MAPQAASTPTAQDFEATCQLIHDELLAWLRRETAPDLERIDRDASLFALGIDSLGAAEVALALEQRTGKTLNPEILCELETINDLAQYVQRVPLAAAPRSATPQLLRVPLNPVADAAADAGQSPPEQPVQREQRERPEAQQDPVQHYEQLNRRIRGLRELDLYFFEPVISAHDGPWVVVDGQRMLMLGSYEYLGLLDHPQLKRAAIETIDQFGTGHHGARLLAGTTTVHKELESRLAAFMRAEDALVFSSGFVANLATISALVGRGECVIGDQWNHASIADGCRMSGAEFTEFQHNDMASLEARLQATAGRRTLVVVDTVFSMDGDIVNLPDVVRLCRQYQALLMVDEAHSLGVLGRTGRGIQEHFDLPPDSIDIKMGTLSKSLAGCGGFVAGREPVVTYLRHHARGYIFSGALPAAQAAAALAALDVLEREPQRVEQLRRNVAHYLSGLKRLGFDTAHSATPIVPIMTRTDELTLKMTRLCRDAGLMVIPVCFPAVPLNAPRLRTCVSAIHTAEEIDFALDVLAQAGRATGLIE